MVNESFVRKYLADQNPIGRHFTVDDGGKPDVEIVGVLQDAAFQNSRDNELPVVFLALFQQADQFALDAEVAIRTAGDPLAAANELRRAIADVDPNLPVDDPRTLVAQVASNFNSQRVAARLVGFFGGLALLLACVGLYGVVSQDVQRRRNEIGVRMALGAEAQVGAVESRETVTQVRESRDATEGHRLRLGTHSNVREPRRRGPPRRTSDPRDAWRRRGIAAPAFSIGALGEYSSCATVRYTCVACG